MDGDSNLDKQYSTNLSVLQREIYSSEDFNEVKLQINEEVPSEESDYDVFRSIPTLVDICLHKLENGEGKLDVSVDCVPVGLDRLLLMFRHQKWLQQVRFEWLLKALCQAERSVVDYLKWSVDQNGRRFQQFHRDTCHVDSLMGTRYTPNSLYIPGMMAIPERVDGYDASDWCIAVLAHTINTLLPTTVADAPSRCTPLNGNDYDKVMAVYVDRVRSVLANWSPKLVHHCFDVALGYVWWSRGYVDKAWQVLLHVADQIPRVDRDSCMGISEPHLSGLQKSLCFNELGRMMVQADHLELACEFYRDPVKFISQESPSHLNITKMSSLVLCASAYDQGIMDHWHAERAATAWDTVMCEPQGPLKITQAALVSTLHCHTGFCVSLLENAPIKDKNKQWLLEAKCRVCSIAEKDPGANFHLSLIQALLGNKEEARIAYGTFKSTAGVEVQGKVANPWWIFSNWMANTTDERGQTLWCMPLRWRRVLGYPGCLLDNQGRTEYLSDVCGTTPNLHITDDGFLTGTLMENIPPMTSFLLDPYTGKFCVPDQKRHVEVQKWDNLHRMEEGNQPTLRSVNSDSEEEQSLGRLDFSYSCGLRADTYIPTPIHLFTNRENGAICSLLISNTIVNYKKHGMRQDDFTFSERSPGISHHVAMLLYSQGTEEFKIDLRAVILRARRDAILKETDNNIRLNSDPRSLTKVHNCLDICVRYGCQIKWSLPQDILEDKQGPLFRNLGKAAESDNSNLIQCLPPPQVVRVSNILFVGKSSVILSVMCATEPYSSQGDNVIVFVDCANSEAFLSPTVHFVESFKTPSEGTHLSSWVLPERKESWESPGNQKVFFAYARTVSGSSSELVVFNEHGVVLLLERVTDEEGYHGCQRFVDCSGWHILGCDTHMTDLISFDVQKKKSNTYHFTKIESFQVAGAVLFVADSLGVVALNAANLVPLVTDCSTDGMVVKDEFRFLRILGRSSSREGTVDLPRNDGERSGTRVFLGLVNRILVLNISAPCFQASAGKVEVTADVALPGIPTEVCYIRQSVGFVVTATVSKERHLSETEVLYWFDMAGKFRGIHPLVGSGPHGIIAVPLKSPPARQSATTPVAVTGGEPVQWYLYFADGFGGICCIKL